MKVRLLMTVSAVSVVAAMVMPVHPAAQEQSAAHQNRSRTPRYDVIDLGVLEGGTFSQANFVNDDGLVVGVADGPDGKQHAVRWRGRQILDLSTSGPGGTNSAAFGVNLRGHADVQAETSAADPNHEDFCRYQSPLACLATLWRHGVLTPLPTLGGNNSTVGTINNRGQVAGMAETDVWDPECPLPQVLDFEAVIWGPEPDQIRKLRPLRGDSVGMALAINDQGQAVGASGRCGNTVLPPIAAGPHAVLWERDGSVHKLRSLGGTVDPTVVGIGNIALSINNSGEVVGASALPGNVTDHAVLWIGMTGMIDLSTLPDDAASAATGINDSGEVVGASFDASGHPRAFLWRSGAMTDLNDLVPAQTSLLLAFASAVNANGEIAGWGLVKSTLGNEVPEIHAFLATPRNRDRR